MYGLLGVSVCPSGQSGNGCTVEAIDEGGEGRGVAA